MIENTSGSMEGRDLEIDKEDEMVRKILPEDGNHMLECGGTKGLEEKECLLETCK